MKDNVRKYENRKHETRRPKYGCTSYRRYLRDLQRLI